NSTCAVCHAIMDPVGLALENFDLVGRWREQEDGHAVNAPTQLTDGTRIAGAADLRRALLARSDAFVAALTERLMTYALGREVEYYDRPHAPPAVRARAAHGRPGRAGRGGPRPLRGGARESHRRERLVPEACEDGLGNRDGRPRRGPRRPEGRRGVIFTRGARRCVI